MIEVPGIIRDGNHFIRIDGAWVLIDGPWFEMFEQSRLHEYHIQLYHPFVGQTYSQNIIVWTREKWTNKSMEYLRIADNRRSAHTVNWTYPAWVCENGILPASLYELIERDII